MESVEQVRQNVAVLENLVLDEKDNKEIEEIRNSLGKKFCRRCEYCMPCAVGINIPLSFLCEGYYTRYGLKEWAKEKYEVMDVKPTECIDCGLCESRCPYELPIREMLKTVVEKLG